MVRASILLCGVALLGCGQKPAATVQKPTTPETYSDLKFVEPKPVSGGAVLRLNPKSGANRAYSLVGEIDVRKVPGKGELPASAIGKSKITMDYTYSVVASDSGSVTLAYASGPLKFEGKAQGEFQQLGGQKGEVRFDRRAGILEDPSSLFEGLFGAGLVLFPESPIGPGSIWSSENTRDMPPFGPVKVNEVFTYKGTELKGGQNVHRIDSSASGLEGMKMSATYFIRSDGLPHSATIDTEAETLVGKKDDGTELWAGFTVKVRIAARR